MVKRGVLYLLKVKDDNTGQTLRTVGASRNATLNLTTEPIDVTTKDSASVANDNFRQRIIGFKDWSIEFEGLYDDADVGLARIKEAFRNEDILDIQFVEANGDIWSGQAIAESNSLETPHEDAASWSGSLTAAGKLTFTAA